MKRTTRWIAVIAGLVSSLAATRASAGTVDLYVSGFSFGEIYAYSLNRSGSLFIPQSPGLNSVAAMGSRRAVRIADDEVTADRLIGLTSGAPQR